jgi:hypothetical protein
MVTFKTVPNVFKVIVQASNLEDGAVVTKKTGQKEYTVRRSIKIYGENRQEIKSDADNIFLVDSEGNINQIKDSTELLVHVRADSLYYDLDSYINDDYETQ